MKDSGTFSPKYTVSIQSLLFDSENCMEERAKRLWDLMGVEDTKKKTKQTFQTQQDGCTYELTGNMRSYTGPEED